MTQNSYSSKSNHTEKRLSLGEHLEELRLRVIYSLISLVITIIICFICQEHIMKVVCQPHIKVMKSLRSPEPLHVLKYQESFMAYLNVSLIAGLMLATPFILWQMWKFISAGLYPHEKKYVTTYVPISLILFVTGVLFGYFFLIPVALKFLASYGNPAYIRLNLTLSSYLGLFFILTLLVGLLFELPLVMLFFSVIGIFSPADYVSKRKLAIVLMFIIAAIITPTSDPITMTLLALPLIGLYELGIIISKLAKKKSTIQK